MACVRQSVRETLTATALCVTARQTCQLVQHHQPPQSNKKYDVVFFLAFFFLFPAYNLFVALMHVSYLLCT